MRDETHESPPCGLGLQRDRNNQGNLQEGHGNETQADHAYGTIQTAHAPRGGRVLGRQDQPRFRPVLETMCSIARSTGVPVEHLPSHFCQHAPVVLAELGDNGIPDGSHLSGLVVFHLRKSRHSQGQHCLLADLIFYSFIRVFF